MSASANLLASHAAHFFPQFDPNIPLTQVIIDGCKLIGIPELAIHLKRSEATIRTQVTRENWKLPPRFPGTTQVLWMWSVVISWQIQQQSKSLKSDSNSAQSHHPSSTPLGTKRRGAPSKAEQREARNAGLTVPEYRARQGA